MSPRHIGVYFVIWACHLCRRDGGWLPRLLWEQEESPLVPGQICKLRRPLVRLYNERTGNLPLASLGARPPFPGRALGRCCTCCTSPAELVA